MHRPLLVSPRGVRLLGVLLLTAGLSVADAGDAPASLIQPATVTFVGVAGHGSPFTTYSEAGFAVSATTANWTVSTTYGHPAPFIQFLRPMGEPTTIGEIQVRAGGAVFSFTGLDVYSSVTNIPYEITGTLNSTQVFTVQGTQPNTAGNFATVTNPYASAIVDTVVIRLSNPFVECCPNPMGLDNIALSYVDPPPPRDFDGDRRSDVPWRHLTNGEVWLWTLSGAVPLSETLVANVDPSWQIRGTGDHDGDGKADLLWRHVTTGTLFLWRMNGTSVLERTYVGVVDPAFEIVASGDLNADDKTDIVWRHTASGGLWVWLMNGARITSATRVGLVAPDYKVVAAADFDGNETADILWQNASNGEVWVWLMNGAVATSQVYLGAVADRGYGVAGLADHDRDGRADVLWRHATRGDVWVWKMAGTTITAITYVATVSDTDYRIVGTGDYDGDGRADALWHHATTGALWVWLMNGATITSATWVATVPDVGYQVVNPR